MTMLQDAPVRLETGAESFCADDQIREEITQFFGNLPRYAGMEACVLAVDAHLVEFYPVDYLYNPTFNPDRPKPRIGGALSVDCQLIHQDGPDAVSIWINDYLRNRPFAPTTIIMLGALAEAKTVKPERWLLGKGVTPETNVDLHNRRLYLPMLTA